MTAATPFTLPADGHVVLRSALSAEAVSALGEALDTYAASLQRNGARSQNLTELMRASGRGDTVFVGPTGDVERIGHRLHEHGAVRAALEQAGITQRLLDLRADIVHVATALICKPPGSPSQFSLHRDTWFLHPDNDVLFAVALALDSADVQHGGLEVISGSHTAPTSYRVRLGADSWQQARPGPEPAPPGPATPIDLQPGDALLYDARLWHGSPANTGRERRRLLIVQCSSADAGWPEDSWIHPPFAPVGGPR